MNRKRGVLIGSAWSWSNRSGTVRTDESAKVGVAEVGGAVGLAAGL